MLAFVADRVLEILDAADFWGVVSLVTFRKAAAASQEFGGQDVGDALFEFAEKLLARNQIQQRERWEILTLCFHTMSCH